MHGFKKQERLVIPDIRYMEPIPLDKFMGMFEDAAAGLENVEVQLSYDDLVVSGWRPMTQAELERQAARSEKARLAAVRRKEAEAAKERELYEKLKAKFDG